MQLPLLLDEGKEKQVIFRRLVKDIPSTTYATFGIYRYPAKFIPQVIAYVLRTYAYPGMTIFDPFAGYGTVGVVARVHGYNYELWDLNPILETIHSTAIMEPLDVDIENLIHQIESSKREFIPQWSNLSYWFPKEFLPFLFKAWGFFHNLENENLRQLLIIPLLKVTRYFSYDDEKVHKLYSSKRAKRKIEELLSKDWEAVFFSMLADKTCLLLRKLKEYQELNPKPVKGIIKTGVDTLTLDLDRSVDILLTSPPYLQAQEYIRTTKLELFWLNYPEAFIRELSKKEIPYREVERFEICSSTYYEYREKIQEAHLLKLFDSYFFSILKAFSKLQEKVTSYMFIFVGPATVRTIPVPIDKIVAEHLSALGWIHELTLIDKIGSHVMFQAKTNPATGLKDERMKTEHLVILKRG